MKSGGEDFMSHLIDRYIFERALPENRHKRLTEYVIDLKPRNRPPGRLSPSSLGGCSRQSAFTFAGVKGAKRVDPELELIFEDGNWRHHKWQAIFQEMEAILGSDIFRCVSIEKQVTMRKLYVRGNSDAHLEIFDQGEWIPVIVDIKGINKFGFADVFNAQEPKQAHVRQLLAYMKAHKVDTGILLYDCKDDQRYTIFVIRMTPEAWADVKNWIKKLLDEMEHQKLPPMHPECNNGNYLYGKCPYRKLCFGRITNVDLERKLYKKFKGLDVAWEQGIALEEE